eukprot:4674505-Amphidinium_carterae.1
MERVRAEVCKGCEWSTPGLDWRTMNIIIAVEREGASLAQVLTPLGVSQSTALPNVYACDGYATSETPEFMPFSQVLAARLAERLDFVRENKTLPWVPFRA